MRLICFSFLFFLLENCETKKNILLILTDDQDVVLGGLNPMTKTKAWLQDGGKVFHNAFVTTPICCPSRASILTGRYQHNTRVVNNSVAGNCNGPIWKSGLETDTFAVHLKNAGYVTFYAGKYLNQYGTDKDYSVPPGWDWWAGLVGNSRYYDYTLSINGKPKSHGSDYEQDYLTDEIGRRASSFLDRYLASGPNYAESSPFLMVLAPPAPHAPFTSAPQYENAYANVTAPRTSNFNYVETKPEDFKHWFVRTSPRPLPQDLIDKVDDVFRNRWRTLLSVDDLVDNIMSRLSSANLLNDTYVIFTSDHGYHLGTFGLPIDKRMPYETDIRVPLIVSGPGIEPNTASSSLVTSIDIAPTILDMAGISKSGLDGMDGISFLPQCIKNDLKPKVNLRNQHWTNRFFAAIEISDSAFVSIMLKVKDPPSRHTFLVEYHGEGGTGNDKKCPNTSHMSECSTDWGCKCQDSSNNTYLCVRTVSDPDNTIFCSFDDHEKFVEMYNIQQDNFQLYNLASQLSDDTKKIFFDQISRLKNCSGSQDCSL